MSYYDYYIWTYRYVVDGVEHFTTARNRREADEIMAGIGVPASAFVERQR